MTTMVADEPLAAATVDLTTPPSAATSPRAVAIGVFDGVHRGHRELLRRLRRAAHRCHAAPAVLTFHPHPRAVVGAGPPPPALCSLRRRIQLLESTGHVDECLVLPFTTDVAALEPDVFVEEILVARLAARHVLVGANFRFGRARAGDLATLADLGGRHGFSVELAELDPVVGGSGRWEQPDGPTHVSSTLIRDRLAGGDVAFARWALDRPHEVEGRATSPPDPAAADALRVEPSPAACVPRPGRYRGRMTWRGLSGTAAHLTVHEDETIAVHGATRRPGDGCVVTLEFLSAAADPAPGGVRALRRSEHPWRISNDG